MRKTWRRAQQEHAFTLIEAVVATALFATVTIAAAGVLTSGIAARSLASQRTAAEQIGNTQLEWIRTLDYDDVGCKALACPVNGLVDATGNQAAQSGPTVPANYSVAIMIRWVDDTVPTAFKTYRNYKTVTVTVRRSTDNKQMSQQSTQIGPRQRAAFGGINLGTVIVQVIDYLSPKNPHPGVKVNLNNGPSSPLSDVTDSAGSITFPGLTPTSGSQYYDLDIPTFDSGWIYLPDTATTHFQLAAGSAPPAKVLEVYKPVTLTFQPRNSDGTTYSSAAVFTVTGPEGSDDFSYSPSPGNPITVTALDGIPLPPGSYTITPKSGMYANPVTVNAPENFADYPSDTTSVTSITSDALGSIRAVTTSGGFPVPGVVVSAGGGPRAVPTQTATTNASGSATFSGLPAGSGYTVSAPALPSQSATVTGGGTTVVTFTYPTGNLRAVVTWAGVQVPGATVTLTGGAGSVSLSGVSNASGEVVFSNLPGGGGYTMTATKSGQSATANPVVVVGITNVPLMMPTVSLLATVTWLGSPVNAATVALSGGPMSIAPVTGTTGVTGQVTFTNVPAGSGYTLTATKNLQTKTLTSQTVATSPITSIGIALPTGTIRVDPSWAGRDVAGATVTITGGPNSPTVFTGTTDATGVANIVVPTTSATYPYTVTVTRNGGTGTATVTSLAEGATATVTPALTPTKTLTIRVRRSGSNLVNTAVVVRITGGPNSPAEYGGTYTTDGSGYVVPITVPMGAGGYTVDVWLSNCALYPTFRSDTNTGVNSTSSGNTSTTIDFTVSGAACPLP